MFILLRRTYTAGAQYSGPAEYVCSECGARASAHVAAFFVGQSDEIYGFGGSQAEAHRNASAGANVQANGAVRQAPCPACGKYPSALVALFDRHAELIPEKLARGRRVALLVGLVVFVLTMIPALIDFRESLALPVFAVSVSVAAFLLTFGCFAWPPPAPVLASSAAIHFWWGRPDGTVGWVAPVATTPLRSVPQPRRPFVAVMLSIPFVLIGIVSIALWSQTFLSVYVIAPMATPILLDGKDVTAEARPGFQDANVRKLTVRTRIEHRITVEGDTWELSRRNGASGWVVVPKATERNLCFVADEVIYGNASTVEPVSFRVSPVNGMIELGARPGYTDFFTSPPRTQEVRNNETVKRLALRVMSCDEVVDGRVSPSM